MSEKNNLNDKGLSGLQNLGNTCYINTCMQLLSHTNMFNELLDNLDEKKINNTIDGTLLKEWNSLRKMLWSSNCTVAPVRFIKVIQIISKKKEILEFSGFNQNDIQEFLIFIIDSFHNGLKREVDMNISGNIKNNMDELATQCYKMIQDMYKKEYSEMLNIFYGIMVNQIKSSESENILSKSCEPFSILSLSIPLKGQSTILECFDNFTKNEKLEGENAWFNEKTNKKEDVNKNILFWNLPEILIIILKRYDNFHNKINSFITCDEIINLSKYICGYNPDSYIYELYGVGNHSGNLKGGHYTANIKYSDGNWYNVDDAVINKINKNIVTLDTYCLFYRKKNKY